MSARYFCKDGDMIDAICWKHYGKQSGAVEAVLEANPDLAAAGPILKAGTILVLPDLETVADKAQVIELWS